jgi:hypothetical protein
LASVRAWQELSDAISLGGNAAARYYHTPLAWHLRWVLLGIFISSAFVVAARGRSRFAAALPLVICAFVAFGLVVLWPHASA